MPNPKEPPFSRNAVALPVGGSENPNSNHIKLPEAILRDVFAMKPTNTPHHDYGIFSVACGNSCDCVQATFAISCLKAAQKGWHASSAERAQYLRNTTTKTIDATIGDKFTYVITEGVPNLSLVALAEYALLKSWEIRALHPLGDLYSNTGTHIRSNSPANTMYINIQAPQNRGTYRIPILPANLKAWEYAIILQQVPAVIASGLPPGISQDTLGAEILASFPCQNKTILSQVPSKVMTTAAGKMYLAFPEGKIHLNLHIDKSFHPTLTEF